MLYYERSKMCLEEKKLDEALNDVNRALGLDSLKAEFYLVLADIHFIKKEGTLAKEALNKCLKVDPENTEAYLKLSEIYFLVEQYVKAIELINKAIKIDLNNSKAYFMKGMNYKYMGDTMKAISSMQTAVEQNNDYYDAYIQLGLMYGAKHDSMAVSFYDNALRIIPNSVEGIYNKSVFLQDHGYFEEALGGYQKILEIDSNYFQAYFNIGFVLLVFKKNYRLSINNFTKAINAYPDYFEAFCNRGIAYEQLKDFKNAEADFRKALEIKPDYTPAAKGISRVVDKDFE